MEDDPAPEQVTVQTRLDPADHQLLERLARRNQRSLAGEIRYILRDYLYREPRDA